MKNILVALNTKISEKNAPYSTTGTTRKVASGVMLFLLVLAFGILAITKQTHAADRHNFRSGKFLAEKQLGTDNDCKVNQLGQIGHLRLADEKIISTDRTRNKLGNLFLDLSFSVSSLGFSEAQVAQFHSQIKNLSSRDESKRSVKLSDIPEIAAQIQSLKPVLSISRNGRVIASSSLSDSLNGWVVSNGAWYCSADSPLTVTLRANILKLNFLNISPGDLDDEGLLIFHDIRMRYTFPKLKKGDLVLIHSPKNYPETQILYQAKARKRPK